MCQQTKLFVVKFRCILEVLHLEGLHTKSSEHIFKKFASRNKAVCCRVQMQLRSFRLARFIKIVLGAFSQFMRSKMKLFVVKFIHIFEVLHLQGLQKKFWAHFHNLYVQKRSFLL